jgi:apolipoprotein D and lipocalin family protein
MKGYPALNKPIKRIKISLILVLLAGCTMQNNELKTVEYIDVNRFMGDWYVIESIPTLLEKNIFNAIENYKLNPDGTIQTTFTYNAGGFDGKRKTYSPKGFIANDGSNAIWGMQFIWPIKADYRVIYVASDYSYTIIGRNKRDYVWIMARTPIMTDDDLKFAFNFIENVGYDSTKLVHVPQNWSSE